MAIKNEGNAMHFTHNQRKLIGLLIVEGPLSRTSIASKLKLTKAAVTIMTQPLIEENFVKEIGEIESGKVGRKETLIDLGSSQFIAIGLDVRHDCINISVTNLRGELQDFHKVNTLKNAVNYIKKLSFNNYPYYEIAVLLRGFKGMPTFDCNIEQIESLMKEANLNYKIVHNVAALAILHKFYFPLDMNFLVVKYGPGVGSAIMTNGQLLSNNLYAISEFGHMLIDKDTTETLEEKISYSAIDPSHDEIELIEMLDSSEEKLKFIMSHLAYCIANAYALLALSKIVIAGLLFVSDNAFRCLHEELQKYEHILKKVNLVRFDDYKEKEKKIGSLVALYNQFLNF